MVRVRARSRPDETEKASQETESHPVIKTEPQLGGVRQAPPSLARLANKRGSPRPAVTLRQPDQAT